MVDSECHLALQKLCVILKKKDFGRMGENGEVAVSDDCDAGMAFLQWLL